MITMKSMQQMRSSQNIRSFHACSHITGVPTIDRDKLRIAHEERVLMVRKLRHFWLNTQWYDHFGCAASFLRVLPPSARGQLLMRD